MKTLHTISLFIMLTLLPLAYWGCAGGQRITIPATLSFDSPEEALRHAGCGPVSGVMTATARIEITDGEKRYPLKAALMAKHPSSLRLESIPLLGPPDLFVSLDAGKMRIYIPSKTCFCVGAATSRNINKFLHVDIGDDALVPLLFGGPGGSLAKGGGLSGRQEDNLYRIDRRENDNRRLTIWIDPSIGKIVRMAFQQDGKTIYDAAFERHEPAGACSIPRTITITTPESGAVKIRYSDLQIAPDTGEPFALPVPEGIPITLLD